MSPRALVRVLVLWAVATAAVCWYVHRAFALEVDEARPLAVVASVWRGGHRVARAVLASSADVDSTMDEAGEPGSTHVLESVVAEGPVVAWPPVALALSVVPGREGLVARIDGRASYLTPDDLLAMQAYDHGLAIPSIQLTAGLDVPAAMARAADELGVPVPELAARGTLRRIRVVRTAPSVPRARPGAEDPTDEDVREATVAMARYLARGVDPDGRFRYLVDAPTNRTLAGYDWPRHAGATYFLAQAAALVGPSADGEDGNLGFAALRAAGLMRDRATAACGDHRCIGVDAVADVGSTSLAVLAFVEIARTGLDEGYALFVPELTAFLRAQQRPDGELMHLYDRAGRRPIDVQLIYFSGEAAFALARAHALLGDARDLDAARRLLAHLVGPAWSFLGSRYYRGEEHWTCQAMDDLWDRAPSHEALDFCLAWQEYGRALMYGPRDTPFDADGAYGVGPILTPHLTPTGSRSEAGIATLDAALRAGRPAVERELLEAQMRRSLALLLRHQLRGTPSSPWAHLLVDPQAVDGAMPGSEVDWQLRIDYVQHTGCALIRWLQRAKHASRATPLKGQPN
jgi:hypothetical protein